MDDISINMENSKRPVVTKLIGALSANMLFEVIKICSQLSKVREEVIKNHDDNKWWPLSVEDWRLRMVVAGWSTRISYNMISTYQQVVRTVNTIGYDCLCIMSDLELQELVGPLGLSNSRIRYFKSLKNFLDELEATGQVLIEMPNDFIIEMLANNVKGASFKVAQCAVLYAKGYHCGIFPVDSGMKDMLGPCLGLQLPKGPIAHEIMRKHIEGLLNSRATEYYELTRSLGYEELAIPKDKAPIWWAHLVLIYFKRLYCNKRTPELCPLRADFKIGKCMGAMCDRQYPQVGGFRYIILEGVDKTGKTTVAEELKKIGYTIIHSPYNPSHLDIGQHYRILINEASTPVVFDRSFISEMTYGQVIRGKSRLSQAQFNALLALLSEKDCIVLNVKAEKDVIQKRLLSTQGEHASVLINLEQMIAEYDKWMEKVADFVPVYDIYPSTVPKNLLLGYILGVVNS